MLCFNFIAMTAHAAAPHASGYLSDYSHLHPGKYLEAYWIDVTKANPGNSTAIQLGEIAVDRIHKKKGVTVNDSETWLRNSMLVQPVISNDQPDAAYRLDLAITHMDPGSATKRIMAGELGAGHAQVQVEGKVIAIASGEVVAAFAERRSSSGAIGLQDLKGDSGPELIEHLIKLISDDVNSELRASFFD